MKSYKIKSKILTDYNSDYPESNVYILTGVRGAGKTVMRKYLIINTGSKPTKAPCY